MQELRRVRSGILSEKEKVSIKTGQEWCVERKIWHLCRSRTHLSFAIITVYLPTFDTLFG